MGVRLLGAPRWAPAGGRESALAPRDALLLAILALDGPQTRARAAALLWPDSDPRRANLSLRQRIFRLKRAAGSDVIVGDTAIRLADAVRHDLADLDEGLRTDEGHARGELLAGIEVPDPEDELAAWLAAARARWQDGLQQRLAALAEDHEAAGRLAQALPYAERLVAEAPSAEHAHRRLMRLHYLRGDRAAALAAYRRCEQWLARELGEAPGAETRSLAALLHDDARPPAALAPPSPALLRPPRLVGRDDAMQRLAAAWQAGRHVLLSGEPGIGKSRLLSEVVQGHGADRIECRPGDAALPYAVVTRLVQGWRQRYGAPAGLAAWAVAEWARFVPSLGRAAEGPPNGARLHAALVAWAGHVATVAAAGGGAAAALVVDDLQFADAASLEALLALLSQVPASQGPRALLAVRTQERPPVLQDWLASPQGEGTEELLLQALDAQAVAELLLSLQVPGLAGPRLQAWADALWRHAGGSPFFTLQTLLTCTPALAGDPPERLPVPQHVGQLLQRRLGQLGGPARQLAQLAALAEPDFSVALAAQVLQRRALDLAPTWNELEAAQVLRNGGLAHDLVREAVLATVPPPIAAELHRQIACNGAAAGLGDERLAEHAWAGGDWALALERAEAAAAQAGAQGLAVRRLALLDRAAAAAQRLGDRARRHALALEAARAAHEVEPSAAVERRLQELDGLAATPGEKADLALLCARWNGYRSAPQEMLAAAERAVRLADLAAAASPPAAAPSRTFEAACLLAAAQALAGRAAEALPTLERWRAVASEHPDARLRHDWHANLGYVLAALDRRRDAIAPTEQALVLAEQVGDLAQATTHAANLITLHSYLGNLDAAARHVARTEALRERVGAPDSLIATMTWMNAGAVLMRLGRFDAALDRLQRAADRFAADAAAARWAVAAHNHLAALWLGIGQPARAQALLAGQPAGHWRSEVLRSRLPRPAASPLPALRTALGTTTALLERLGLMLALAEHEAPDVALALTEQIEREAGSGQLDAWALAARLRRAQVLARLGRAAEAGVLAAHVEAQLLRRQHAADLTLGDAWIALAQVRGAAGDAAQAEAARERSRRWLWDEAWPHVPLPFRDGFRRRYGLPAEGVPA
ncbi:MAG: AAA family ATPase [Rubrivivax sp.]|nr:AAA family ATPase [Rubrivivax sp.]